MYRLMPSASLVVFPMIIANSIPDNSGVDRSYGFPFVFRYELLNRRVIDGELVTEVVSASQDEIALFADFAVGAYAALVLLIVITVLARNRLPSDTQ
jgi:hypothetical protein